MEITIYCSNCKEKTPHTLEEITIDKYDNNPYKWMCNNCKDHYHAGDIYFKGKEHSITKDRKTKKFLINRLKP